LIALLLKAKERFEIKKQQEHRERTAVDKSPHFVQNRLLQFLSEHLLLVAQIKKKRIKNWDLHFDYVDQLLEKMEAAPFYARYAEAESHNWESDCTFVIALYREVIAPHDPLFDYLEDQKLGWADDFSLVNTFIVKQLKKIQPEQSSSFQFPTPADQKEEKDFGKELLKKTVSQREVLEKEIEGKTPNWESDRIAQLDQVLLQLGISELLFFDNIPPKVTLNEYLEIAKDYSTPMSNVFINGVLDKLVKEFTETNRMKKSGRGLRE
jgi:N utilization substance protein B